MRVLSIAALLFFGCTDGDDDNPDTGVLDVGFLPDGCNVDNPPRDSGINLPPCTPANGTGCEVSSGRYCVWSYQQDRGQCRCLGDAPKQVDEACSINLQDCAAGLVCLTIDNVDSCRPVCTQANPTECDQYSTPETVFACFALIRPDGTRTESYGLCVGAGRPCSPLDDQCAATETCVLVSPSVAVCRPSGPVPIGGNCELDECAKGGVCVPLVDPNGNPLGTNCYEPCDLMAATCSAGCTDVGVDGFGLCL